MAENNSSYVLDTSAILTLFENESGADIVERILTQANRGETTIFVSFMSFMECF